MKNVILIVACVVALCMPALVAAQTGTGSGFGSGRGSGGAQAGTSAKSSDQAEAKALADKLREVEAQKAKLEAQNNQKFIRTLTNVQIELTLIDQLGSQPPEKKVVSMIASSGNWGKIRSAGSVFPVGEPPYGVELNVDARPFVSIDGLIQLEMTMVYAPQKGTGDPKEGPRQRPSGINQSQTVVLQSGKALVVSQAADPISDRKVVVEVKATVLK
jgi:hypothetical protein